MNYTIIGHTENDQHYDRWGDLAGSEGKFEAQSFRGDKEKFIRAWAHADFHETYDDIVILINGIPADEMQDDDAETDEYEYEVQPAMVIYRDTIIKVEHERAEKLCKDAAAEAALQQARHIAHMEHQRDLQQLEALQRKLNIK